MATPRNDKGAEKAGRGSTRGLMAWLSRNKGLILLTVPTVVVAGIIVYLTMLLVVLVGECDLLAGHLGTLPGLYEERSTKFQDMVDEYYEDCVIKGDIGALLFDELTELAEPERLEQIKSSVSAMDVSLVEPGGAIVETTRTEDSFGLDTEDIQEVLATETHVTSRLSNYKPAQDGDEVTDEAGTGAVVGATDEAANLTDWEDVALDNVDEVLDALELDAVPPALYTVKLASGRSLVYEFDFTNVGTYEIEQAGWEVLLKEVLSGLDGYAFAYFPKDDSFVGYPTNTSFLMAVRDEVKDAFHGDAGFVALPGLGQIEQLNGVSASVIKLAGKDFFAMRASFSDYGVDAMIVVPVESMVSGVQRASTAFCAFVVLCLVLLVVYLKRTRAQELDAGEVMGVGLLRKGGLAGFVVALVTSVVVFAMFILLEVTASTAAVTKNYRESLQYQIDYDLKLRDQARDEFIERGVTRNNALAQVLSSSPNLRNRQTLKRLADVVGAQYLMLFDESGRELFSSNSYSGMTIGSDESDPTSVYQRVLMGYPYVVTETVHDDILDTDTHTIASLVTDGEGLPDGILVMCVDDTAILARLADTSLESTVSSYPVQLDRIALVVDEESGEILGHSDSSKVGELAENYVDASLLGRNYEGFTFFAGNYSYLSEGTSEGRSTLLVSSSTVAFISTAIIGVLGTVLMLVLFVIYYLLATRIIGGFEPREHNEYRGNPLLVFFYGFVAYFFLLSVYTFICSLLGTWPSFGFVHGSQWSHGVHLFSIWASLFSVCTTLMVVFATKAVLRHLEKTSSLDARTLLRLTNSIVTYGAVLICGFRVLSLLGVDTAALLASAGIVSIAIGMGSKDLITDILAGVFLVSEGSIHVGDIVTVGGWRGRVTDMGVRTCEITNESHDVKIVTNSRINEIVNSSRRRTLCSEEIELKRTVDVDEVPALVDAIIAAVTDEIPELDGTLHMEEITGITEDSYKVRLTYKCDENERESLTFRLKNALQLLLEDGTEELEEAAGIDSDEGKADSAANAEAVPVKGDDKPSTPETA